MMLKSKQNVNYRKAITALDGRFKRCRCCWRRKLTTAGYRCGVIGFDKSRRYEVEADHVCNQVQIER